MSEYQCYEFIAIDRPLTSDEMGELRAISSRAEITPTRFWNEYNFGDFRGDPTALLAKYFDAHNYYANWGTRVFALRVPMDCLDVEPLREYFGKSLTCHGNHVVFELASDLEEPEYATEDVNLGAMIPIRTEIMSGDHRFAYLAWLLNASESGADLREPPVPPGLGSLSEPLAYMADFLGIDADLVAAAAEGSPPLADDLELLKAWVRKMPARTKDQWLVRAVEAPALPLGGQLLRAFRATQKPESNGTRRTFAQIRARADELANERLRLRTLARQREKEAAQRAKADAFTALAKREGAVWKELEERITKSDYLEALRIAGELRDLAAHRQDTDAFQAKLDRLKQLHGKTRRGFFVRWTRQRQLRDV